MKIWQRIWTALLAILMLATFTACAADGNALRAGDDTKFMQGERIRQADLDCLIVRLAEVDEAGKPLEIAPEDVLPVLAVMRAELLEAEEQGLALSWADSRQWAEEYYAGLPDSSQKAEDGQSIWDWTQDYLERTHMTEEDYLDYLAFNSQVINAEIDLRDNFMADFPEEEHLKEETYKAYNEYIKGLVEKYHDELVEDDLLSLLYKVMESL